jgi:hypothetical protein
MPQQGFYQLAIQPERIGLNTSRTLPHVCVLQRRKPAFLIAGQPAACEALQANLLQVVAHQIGEYVACMDNIHTYEY